jgi:hypothetical protein
MKKSKWELGMYYWMYHESFVPYTLDMDKIQIGLYNCVESKGNLLYPQYLYMIAVLYQNKVFDYDQLKGALKSLREGNFTKYRSGMKINGEWYEGWKHQYWGEYITSGQCGSNLPLGTLVYVFHTYSGLRMSKSLAAVLEIYVNSITNLLGNLHSGQGGSYGAEKFNDLLRELGIEYGKVKVATEQDVYDNGYCCEDCDGKVSDLVRIYQKTNNQSGEAPELDSEDIADILAHARQILKERKK